MAPSSPFFQFEADFVEGLRCIPMQVRFKLDTCGVKLKLQHWHQFTPEERRSLVDLSCDGSSSEGEQYRTYLQAMVTRYTGGPAGTLPIEPTPPWQQGDRLPEQVQAEAQRHGLTLTTGQWGRPDTPPALCPDQAQPPRPRKPQLPPRLPRIWVGQSIKRLKGEASR
jgi:hypothetical protein